MLAFRWIVAASILASSSACVRSSRVDMKMAPAYLQSKGDVDRGARLSRSLCVSCHGVYGDGRGDGADGLEPAPRNFVRAVYRYRSTPTGSLPTDTDLARSILRGLPGSSMPAFRGYLDARDVFDLVAWVKSFSPRFAEEIVDDPIDIPPPPPRTAALMARGAELYTELQCGKCHGDDGSGMGWGTEEDFRDDLGRVSLPRDFRIGVYKSGTRAQDLYRTLITGLDGTPMAAYEDTVEPADLYSLVYYVMAFDRGPGLWRWLSEPPTWNVPARVRVRIPPEQAEQAEQEE